MTTDLQPAPRAIASRQKRARSQGHRTAAGKARSARNPLAHGRRTRRLVPLDGEDAAEFRAVATALPAELAPEGRLQTRPGEPDRDGWRARRADRLEAGVLGNLSCRWRPRAPRPAARGNRTNPTRGNRTNPRSAAGTIP